MPVGLVFLLALLSAAAQTASPWSTRVWKADDGLGGNNVTGVAEGADGFLWVVAGGRLTRFDGTQWETWAAPALPAGQEPRFRALLPARNGDLVFLMHDGAVLRAGGGTWAILATDPPPARPETVAEAEDGSLLIAYQNGLVQRLAAGRLAALSDGEGLPAGRDRLVFANDGSGRLWFAKGNEAGVYHDGGFHARVRLPAPVTRLAVARGGGMWIACGLQLYRWAEGGSLQAAAAVPATHGGAHVTALLEDRRGALWIGTSTSGLFRYDGAEFANIPVSHREVSNLREDREGNLWAGTSGGGLNRIQPRALEITGHETGRPYEALQALCEAPGGTLWAVTQDGQVVRRVGGDWQAAFGVPEGFAAEASCIAADRTGAIWVGTRDHRLFRWWDGRLESWGREEGLRVPMIRALVAMPGGDLWIAGGRPAALQRWRDGRFDTRAVPATVDSLWAFATTSEGHLWVGGSNSTLLRVTPDGMLRDESGRIEQLPQAIRSLHATGDGALWMAYDEGGVGRLKNGSFRRLTTDDGLAENNLRLVIADGQGWLWFAAVTAIFKARLGELEAVAEGRATRFQSVRFGREEGVHAILGGTIGPLLDRAGRLWLPLATSLVVAHPDREQEEPEPPPVRVTRFTVDGRVWAADASLLPAPAGAAFGASSLRLPPDHRRIEFLFTAPSFTAPDNLRFRHRLEGIDDRWIEAGQRRSASYSRLPAGEYLFHTQVSNSRGVWNEAGAALRFSVAPFWWETWWFRGAALVVFAGAVFAAARYLSLRRLRERLQAAEQEAAVERERARIARDIHDDLGSRLTKIVLLSGLAARNQADAPATAGRIREISDTARQVMKSLDETVWTVNPANDNLPHLISYVGQLAAGFLQSAEISCRLDLPPHPPPLPIGAEVRHNLVLAVREALANTVRHAAAREVRLSVRLAGEVIEFIVEDDGRGFAPGPRSPGSDGLENMRQRMARVGGSFALETRPEGGTRLTLGIPQPVER